ncbi:uncharacterized protein LOC143012037 isoform X2 [Genypterus blacodes]|uniref:uncharacterized protein LOC143012037 isoform X2 n=1 Tax=Genypterus blacodes TaxID=154954 RepID=UPI003F7708BE
MQEEETNTPTAPRGAAASGGKKPPPPAPRRKSGSSAEPVPAPRTRRIHSVNSLSATGASATYSKPSPSLSDITNPVRRSRKVQTNHPWINIIHPGPWTQLPPAPAPITPLRSKAVASAQGLWFKPRVCAPNPFGEVQDYEPQGESTPGGTKAGDTHTLASSCESGDVATSVPADDHTRDQAEEDGGLGDPAARSLGVPDTAEAPSEAAGHTCPHSGPDLTETGVQGSSSAASELSVTNLQEEQEQGPRAPDSSGPAEGEVGVSAVAGGSAAVTFVTLKATQSRPLPKSHTVPVIPAACPQSTVRTRGRTEKSECERTSQSKLSCKHNPSEQISAKPKSKTVQAPSSQRAPAPGHGFPLIKRKVQTDQYPSTKTMPVEIGDLDKRLEELELQGVELEKNLRDCKNDKEEELLLIDWFSLIQERHTLVCRDSELVLLTKQQKLEERQVDVEYELRCLLNKPESEWSHQDRGREQQLMEELVAIVEQRNQIISSLDQDRQREKEDNKLWDTMMKNKELQREGLKELKKSKGKFKPLKVFKALSLKAERSKNSKKS